MMGEAGPEAIMPLARTKSGDLGIKAENATPVVNVNVQNMSSEKVNVSRDNQSGDIRVVIGEAVRGAFASGEMDGMMGNRYGLRRGGIR